MSESGSRPISLAGSTTCRRGSEMLDVAVELPTPDKRANRKSKALLQLPLANAYRNAQHVLRNLTVLVTRTETFIDSFRRPPLTFSERPEAMFQRIQARHRKLGVEFSKFGPFQTI